MAGRPRIFNENDALKKAAELFWARGYEAASTEELIRVMGVQRGSFYNAFNSKRELFIKAINYYEESLFLELKQALQNCENKVEALRMIFLDMAECGGDDGFKRGCFSGNTLAELSGIDEELANYAKGHLKELETIIYTVIAEAKEKGELKTAVEPRLLARYFLTMWNGLNITRRIYGERELLRPLIELQLELLR